MGLGMSIKNLFVQPKLETLRSPLTSFMKNFLIMKQLYPEPSLNLHTFRLRKILHINPTMVGVLPTSPPTEPTTRAGTRRQTTPITPMHTTLDQTPVETLDLLVPILVTAKSVEFRDIQPRSAHPIALFLIHHPPQQVLQRQILQHHGSLEPILLQLLHPTIQHGY